MELTELEQIINKGEGAHTEFKRAFREVPGSLYETAASFSNTRGGVVLLGVNDDGTVSGVCRNASLQMQNDIIRTSNNRNCIDPPLYLQPFTVEHRNGLVMVLQIPESSQVHKHAGKIFYREHENDLDVTDDQQKLAEMFHHKRNFFTETTIYPYLSMDDLDPSLFYKVRQLIRNNKSDHPWIMVNDAQMLRDAVLWRRDFKTGEEGLTLAAALIFGKDTTIQSLLPAYKVEALVRIENTDRWDDRIVPPLRTNLINTYFGLKAFINKHLPEKFFVEGDQRIDLRDKVFREVIGNAIIHREYTSAIATELLISATEVRISNPNNPLFHGVIDPDGFNPHPKNPNIRKFFTALGLADEIGSGVRNTNKYLPFYANGARPVFYENQPFVNVIPLQHPTLADHTIKWMQWLGLEEKALSHLQTGLKEVALPSALHNKQWNDVILHLVPSWNKTGTQLSDLKWPEKQIIKKEEIEKVPSFHEKSTQLLQKKSRYLISILSLCGLPLALKEIMKYMDYKNEKTFRDNYIKPLRNSGLIAFTMPDKLTDPDNKYTLTGQGKLFLSGQIPDNSPSLTQTI